MMWIINLTGLLLIGFIVWWFWLYRAKPAQTDDKGSPILVENGVYQPATIHLKAGQPTTLTFLRKDPSPCAEMVLIPAIEVSETLPLNKPKTIQLAALKAGEYPFHCQMQMYRGRIIVDGGE